LGEEHQFIASRFLASLVTHVKDTESTVGVGFVIYGLKFNPRLLNGIFNNQENLSSLK